MFGEVVKLCLLTSSYYYNLDMVCGVGEVSSQLCQICGADELVCFKQLISQSGSARLIKRWERCREILILQQSFSISGLGVWNDKEIAMKNKIKSNM